MSCIICPRSGAKVCGNDCCGLCICEDEEEFKTILLRLKLTVTEEEGK